MQGLPPALLLRRQQVRSLDETSAIDGDRHGNLLMLTAPERWTRQMTGSLRTHGNGAISIWSNRVILSPLLQSAKRPAWN